MTSWPDLVTSAAATCTAILGKGADQDWSRRAGELDWSCETTLDHLALGVVGYAGLLIAQPTDRYIALFASIDQQVPIPVRLEGIQIASTLLAATVRDADAHVRAWHPWGHSDRGGFAAMGVTELVVHTHDITRTLGLEWNPPEKLCAPVVRRLFPDAPAGHDPARTLLWCTGRLALPGIGRRGQWRWDGSVRAGTDL
jgi:hypothetical protein